MSNKTSFTILTSALIISTLCLYSDFCNLKEAKALLKDQRRKTEIAEMNYRALCDSNEDLIAQGVFVKK